MSNRDLIEQAKKELGIKSTGKFSLKGVSSKNVKREPTQRELIEKAKKELGIKSSGKFSLKGISSSSSSNKENQEKTEKPAISFDKFLSNTNVSKKNVTGKGEDDVSTLICRVKQELGISPNPNKKKFSLKGISSRGDQEPSKNNDNEDRKKLIEEARKELGIPGPRKFSLRGISSSDVHPKKDIKKDEKKDEKKDDEEDQENNSDSDDEMLKLYRNRYSYSSDSDNEDWVEPKSVDEKRKLYQCGDDYVTLANILPWPTYGRKKKIPRPKKSDVKYEVNETLNSKISMWKGDITSMEIDAIVNAANRSLMGGGGVDGAIHSAAGSYFIRQEVRQKHANGCETGDCKLTKGYKLPAKYILHTVGPVNEDPDELRRCYESTLKLAVENNIKTLAFCCVATGIYGFPLRKATHIALNVTRKFLEKNHSKIERIIFCVFLDIEEQIYERFIPFYFPRSEKDVKDLEMQSEVEPQTPKYTGFSVNFNWEDYIKEYGNDDDSDNDNDSDTLVRRNNRSISVDENDDEFLRDPLD